MNMFKKNGGFTLVELIVVIAILAILAAVAVPAYSGYINSANEAAENQKIEAINTAISAAMAMHGENVEDAATYFKAEFANKKLTITPVADANTDRDDKIWASFEQFYGCDDKAEVEFQYYVDVDFNTNATKGAVGELIGTAPAN